MRSPDRGLGAGTFCNETCASLPTDAGGSGLDVQLGCETVVAK